MPIDAIRQIAVEQTDKPFNRLAIRCSMIAELNNNALKVGTQHTISLHATRYRKMRRTVDNAAIVEVCGQDDAESGLSAIAFENADNDALILAMARRCRNQVLPSGTSAKIVLNFSWRRQAGDITGMLQMIVTPTVGGDPIQIVSGDTEADSLTNTQLSDLMQSLFQAIKNRSDLLNW